MESDQIPLSSAIFFGTENNSESRLGTGKHVTMVAKGLYRDLVSIGLWECLLRGHKGFWEGSESARLDRKPSTAVLRTSRPPCQRCSQFMF